MLKDTTLLRKQNILLNHFCTSITLLYFTLFVYLFGTKHMNKCQYDVDVQHLGRLMLSINRHKQNIPWAGDVSSRLNLDDKQVSLVTNRWHPNPTLCFPVHLWYSKHSWLNILEKQKCTKNPANGKSISPTECPLRSTPTLAVRSESMWQLLHCSIDSQLIS